MYRLNFCCLFVTNSSFSFPCKISFRWPHRFSNILHAAWISETVNSIGSFWCTFLPSFVGGRGFHCSCNLRVQSLWSIPLRIASFMIWRCDKTSNLWLSLVMSYWLSGCSVLAMLQYFSNKGIVDCWGYSILHRFWFDGCNIERLNVSLILLFVHRYRCIWVSVASCSKDMCCPVPYTSFELQCLAICISFWTF